MVPLKLLVCTRLTKLKGHANPNEDVQEILDWLSPLKPYKIHEDVKNKQRIAKGSGSWFLESETFCDWRDNFDNEHQLVWCPGYPGVGKTVLATIIIDQLDELRNSSKTPHSKAICWFYLGDENFRAKDPGPLLQYLLKHLIQQQCRPSVPECLESLYNFCIRREMSPSEESIRKCIDLICMDLECMYIVFDAFEEYSERRRNMFIRRLREIQSKFSPKIKILITSRYIQGIQHELGKCLRIAISAIKEGIEAYIKEQISDSSNLIYWTGQEPTLSGEICDMVVTDADGM